MVSNTLRRCVTAAAPCLLLSAVVTLHAQPTAAPRADPLDPKADVPPLRYESSLAAPARASGGAPIGWREANDAVARIGGWRAYAREAQQAAPPVAPARAASAPTMPGGHGSQGGHAGGRQP